MTSEHANTDVTDHTPKKTALPAYYRPFAFPEKIDVMPKSEVKQKCIPYVYDLFGNQRSL